MKQLPLTEKEYVRQAGSVCPFCGSLDISASGPVDLDGSEGWQAVDCNDCLTRWQDIYNLTGYEPV